MTLENIKQKLVIEKYGYENGFHNLFHEMLENGKANILLDDLCCEYAKQKCAEQREICAANAEILNLQAQAHPDSDPITIQQINIKRIWDAPEPNFD